MPARMRDRSRPPGRSRPWPFDRLFGVELQKVFSLQVGVVCRSFDDRRPGCVRAIGEQCDSQGTGHGARNVLLDGKEVIHRAVVGIRPELKAALGVDQLRGNPHAILRAADAALEKRRDAERGANRPRILLRLIETDGRGAAHDPQLRILAKLAQ